MSNQSLNTSNMDNEKPLKNDTVTSVEVLKADAVNSGQDKSGKKDNDDRAGKKDKSDKKPKSNKEAKSNKEDKYSLNIGAIYQWACKLKDDIKSETSDKTAEISEKSAAMMLHKLLDSIDGELEVFDKKLEDSKKLIANAEEERQKIVDKKDKYQGMIAQLEN